MHSARIKYIIYIQHVFTLYSSYSISPMPLVLAIKVARGNPLSWGIKVDCCFGLLESSLLPSLTLSFP